MSVGVTEYWRAARLHYPTNFTTHDTDLFLIKAIVTYHAPAYFDDLLEVCVRCAQLGRSSITYALAIHRQETHLTEGELTYVCANPKTRLAQPLPETIRQRLSHFKPFP
ncbi:MAG: acyl-CoA thioesterase [Acidobacteriota bacterium]